MSRHILFAMSRDMTVLISHVSEPKLRKKRMFATEPDMYTPAVLTRQ